MPRLLAIEWDQLEARIVMASVARGRLTVEQAGAIRLPETTDGEKLPAAELGRAIRAGLTAYHAGSAQALVGVSRSSIELCQLALPPTPDEELPELVRYQAARELSSLTDASLLDFVPLPAAPGEQRTVLAAALSSEQAEQIQGVCDAAGIRPQQMPVRPHAAGSLFHRQMRPSERVSLLVTCLEDEADLAVLVDGQVLLCRTVRPPKPAEGEPATAPLLAEIRRTIFAVQNQPGGGPVSAVFLCGEANEHHELIQKIQEEFFLPAEVYQPFEGLNLSRELKQNLPQHPGRYTALLGMLADEAAGSHAIDFLHPRRKPEPVNRRRLAIAAAAVVGFIVLAGGYVTWSKFKAIDLQIANLTKQLKGLDQTVKRAEEKEAAVSAIEGWQVGDVAWLDELRDLSLRFPRSRDAVIARMNLTGRPTGGGAIELEGIVRDPSIVGQMENGLRDDYHEVRTKRVQESVQGATHTWKFDSSLLIAARDKSTYQSHLSPEEVAATAQSEKSTAARESKSAEPPQTKKGPDANPAAQLVPAPTALNASADSSTNRRKRDGGAK